MVRASVRRFQSGAMAPYPAWLIIVCREAGTCQGNVSIITAISDIARLSRKGPADHPHPSDLSLAQPFNRSLRSDGRIIDFLKRVRPRLRLENREYLNVPVIIVIEGLPISQSGRRMLAIR